MFEVSINVQDRENIRDRSNLIINTLAEILSEKIIYSGSIVRVEISAGVISFPDGNRMSIMANMDGKEKKITDIFLPRSQPFDTIANCSEIKMTFTRGFSKDDMLFSGDLTAGELKIIVIETIKDCFRKYSFQKNVKITVRS